MKPPPSTDRSSRAFPITRWSVVVEARDGNTGDAAVALEDLCRTYWMPLYAYVRRCGHSPCDAEDLTQEFFARFLEKHWLQAADREKGRFRTFLMVTLKRFLVDEWRSGQAAKRGGGRDLVPLDTQLAERLYSGSGAHSLTPEQLFDKRWALALMETAFKRIEAEYLDAGREREFEILMPCLTAGRGGVDYGELTSQLGLSDGAARVAVHRIRKRYRSLFREEIARTVRDQGDVEDEMRALLQALAGSS